MSNTNPVIRSEGRGALGYNGEQHFLGAVLNFFASAYAQENTEVINSNSRSTYQLLLGYRLKAPKILRDGVDEIYIKKPF